MRSDGARASFDGGRQFAAPPVRNASAPPMWWLELDGVPPRAGRPARIALRRDVRVPTTIGRLAASGVMMMDPTLPQQYISRSHATITVRPRPLRPLLVNLSLNGTKVDTRALVRDESTDLYPGEAVVFGHRASATEYRYIVRHRDLAGLLRAVGRSIGRLLALQRRAAERVYAPSGAGYHEAASSFAGAASQQSTQQEASPPAASSSALDAFFDDDDDEPAAAAKRPLDAAPSPPRKRERADGGGGGVAGVAGAVRRRAVGGGGGGVRRPPRRRRRRRRRRQRRGVDRRRRRRRGGGVAGARGGRWRVAGGAEGRAPVRRVRELLCRPHAAPCGHFYCGGCIFEWAKRPAASCPLCREPFGAEPPKLQPQIAQISARLAASAFVDPERAEWLARAEAWDARAAAERAAWTARAEAKAKADDDGAAATLHALEVGYTAEYARSGRSTCRRCLRRIGDGELRYGVRTRVPIFAHTITAWHHARCLRLRECPGLDDVADVEGFAALRPADQRPGAERPGQRPRAASGWGGDRGARAKADAVRPGLVGEIFRPRAGRREGVRGAPRGVDRSDLYYGTRCRAYLAAAPPPRRAREGGARTLPCETERCARRAGGWRPRRCRTA